MVNPEYLEAIKRKLDSLNKEAGINPAQAAIKSKPGTVQYSRFEDSVPDPLEWQGQAAINYLNSIRCNKPGNINEIQNFPNEISSASTV